MLGRNLGKLFNPTLQGTGGSIIPPSTRTNLVPDPRFLASNNGTYWSASADYTFVSTGGHIDGGYVLQVSTTGFADFVTVNDSNGIPVVANTSYVCSFWYNPVSVVGNPEQYQINMGSAYGTTVANGALNATGGWQRLTVTVNTGANTLLYIRVFNNNSAVTYYYSNFQCELTTNAGGYFDGSFPHAFWTGAADNSASVIDL